MATLGTLYNQVGTNQSFLFRDSTDYSPSANSVITEGTPTAVQIDCTSLADGSARQSAKCDLGANRAPGYFVRAAIEFAATPSAGEYVEFWWSPSSSATAAVGNSGGASGSDAAYTGYNSDGGVAKEQLVFVGRMIVTAEDTATVQIAEVGYLRPPARYGSLVLFNESGAALHSDMAEFAVVFQPDIQAVDG